MPTVKADLVVLGSGISASIAYTVASRRNLNVLAIDPSFRTSYPLIIEEVNLKNSSKRIGISKLPILTPNHKLYIDKASCVCYNMQTNTLKSGDYLKKIVAYETPEEYQLLWPLYWYDSKTLCYNALYTLFKNGVLSSPQHIVSNVRVIDVERKLVVLSNGLQVLYNRLIYTWPLDRVLYYIKCTSHYCKKIHQLLNTLRLRAIGVFILILILKHKSMQDIRNEKSIAMFIHATKASRMHTTLLIPLNNGITLLYSIASFSNRYPLLPGIVEKLYSELRKFKILTEFSTVIHEIPITYLYGVLNKPDTALVNELKEIFIAEYNFELFGRVAEWREYALSELLNRKPKLLS